METLGKILRLEFREVDMARRCGEGIGAMGTSVTYVAGTYSGFVLLAAPILRTCRGINGFIIIRILFLSIMLIYLVH